jgi:hypothetical protein
VAGTEWIQNILSDHGVVLFSWQLMHLKKESVVPSDRIVDFPDRGDLPDIFNVGTEEIWKLGIDPVSDKRSEGMRQDGHNLARV